MFHKNCTIEKMTCIHLCSRELGKMWFSGEKKPGIFPKTFQYYSFDIIFLLFLFVVTRTHLPNKLP